MTSSGRVRAGVEIGGTFTDLIWLRPDGTLGFAKVPSTPDAPERAALTALERAGVEPESLPELVHGSTVATNAVLTRRGARTAFITTRGFRDILELQRHDRWGNIYDVFYRKPQPLVSRDLAFEVTERLDANGEVVKELDEESVRAALDAALAAGATSVAVALLHAWKNPVHELRVAEIASQHTPDLPLTLSSDVLPEFREYERASTVVMSAYVRPVMERYLSGLSRSLHERGYSSSLSVMQSSGGVLPAEAAGRHAIRTLLSGPAAGVIGAATVARLAGIGDVITIDMGGTSTDVALLRDGRPLLTRESKIDGLPLGVPMIDITTVGAGGGSIARVDSGGLLDVGPGSAGADPGPACYGRGGSQPTVTDANVVLGLLRPAHFLGGEMRLEPELAREAVASLGVSDNDARAAAQIVRVVDANMTQAIRLVSTERGIDPTDLTLVPYGGAGPLHACRLAEELGMRRVLVPPFPGLISAYGLLVADLVVDVAQTDILDDPNIAGIAPRFAALDERLAATIREQNLPTDGWTVEASIDMRYSGQAYELVVPVARPDVDVASIVARFHDLHGLRYGVSRSNDAVQAVTWRLRASRPVPDLPLPRPPANGQPNPEHAAVTLIDGPATIPFYERGTLPLGFSATGPSVIEEPTATTFVPAGWTFEVDEHGCLLVLRDTSGRGLLS
ncbi:MAG TPA: hydantoinase/oxoprolinase family protein [Thermomicrobiales bacterium]|nr:hydantoinase/oxoprolinase family protein [Thermomicrobiales bacterium]